MNYRMMYDGQCRVIALGRIIVFIPEWKCALA